MDAVHAKALLLSIAREIHRPTAGPDPVPGSKPHLIALYLPTPREEAVFRKAVQTGISEALIQPMLLQVRLDGSECAYALPDNKIAGGSVADRINR